MSDQTELLRDTWPSGVNLSAFEHATNVHAALRGTLRIRADDSINSSLTKPQVAQREALLVLVSQILVKERNRALDDFATSWLKARGKLV